MIKFHTQNQSTKNRKISQIGVQKSYVIIYHSRSINQTRRMTCASRTTRLPQSLYVIQNYDGAVARIWLVSSIFVLA